MNKSNLPITLRIWLGSILGGYVIWLVIASVLTAINISIPGWLMIIPMVGIGYWLKGKTWAN